MPIRIALPALAIGCLVVAGEARAQTFEAGPYIGASAGALFLRDNEDSIGPADTRLEFKPGYTIAGQLGYRFSALRTELEVEYGKTDLDEVEAAGVSVDADGDLRILRGTAGAYVDLTIVPLLTPYVGGGAGVAHIKGDAEVVDGLEVELDDDTHLTAHAEAGVALDFLPLISIVPAYRFVWIDNGNGGVEDLTAHVVKLGARLEF